MMRIWVVQGLLPPRAGYAVMGAVAALVAATEVQLADRYGHVHLGLVLGLWAAVLALWAARARLPLWVWPPLMAAAAVALALTSRGAAAPFALFVFLISAGGRADPRLGVPLAGLAVAAFLVIAQRRSPGQDVVSTAFTALGYTAAYLLAYAVRRLRDERQHLREALEELRLSRQAQLEAAKVEERARLAREIHDVLAHTLSALSVQLEGARLLVQQHPSEPAAAEALERAQRLTREGLREARRAVGALRGDAVPGPEVLPALAAEFQRDTGVPCRLEVEGEARRLSQEAALALYRTAQEALSNVRKHAAATAVRVRLRWGGDGTELTVDDEGVAMAPVGEGYGLTGMRERAELLGGRLEAGPVPGGFRVRLWIPASAGEPVGSPG
jgi:signal transduction histidine kinase